MLFRSIQPNYEDLYENLIIYKLSSQEKVNFISLCLSSTYHSKVDFTIHSTILSHIRYFIHNSMFAEFDIHILLYRKNSKMSNTNFIFSFIFYFYNIAVLPFKTPITNLLLSKRLIHNNHSEKAFLGNTFLIFLFYLGIHIVHPYMYLLLNHCFYHPILLFIRQ